MFEVELKARVHQPEVIKKRAAALGEFVGEFFKEDVYFRRCGDTNPVPPKRYRLRREGKNAVVTFKQPVAADGAEANEEVEFAVDKPHAFFRFANHFGFEPFVVKRKKSQVYQVGRAHIELNKVEYLGHFVEIEILCANKANIPAAEAEINTLLERLGLSQADLEPRLYLVLLQQAHPVRYRFIDNPSLDWPFEETPR
ncbi:MAG: class IV adenylate cyclase [Anaerolineae bacterium]|nr:class IV adenylate cyclase [Anaerolineae bacterium]